MIGASTVVRVGGRQWQRLAERAERRRRRAAVLASSGSCSHHERRFLVALLAEPNGTNPPKHIGYACRLCACLFTVSGAPSQPLIASQARVPHAPLRPSRSHAARLRAADRAGLSVRIDEVQADVELGELEAA